ncbi:MAG: hypothetical protein AAGD11_04205 [Planctomycetota bacterium]
MRCTAKVLFAAALLAMVVSTAKAQTIVASLDTTNLPTNATNGFGGFTFGDFPNFVPAIISSPTDPFLTLDIPMFTNGFGGMGVDFVTSVEAPDPNDPNETIEVNQLTQNFDPSLATWEFRLRIGDNNSATSIRTTMVDVDGPEQDSGLGEGGVLFMQGDEHVYEFDLTGVPVDGNFHTLTAAVDSPLFSQGAFGVSAGNGIVDPGLKQIQIQAGDTTNYLDVEIEFARIVLVPEPTAMALVLLGIAPLGVLRRR